MTGRAARLSTLLTTFGGLGVIIFGPQALRILYGSAYSGALAVLDVLVIEVILSGATLVLCQAFMALGRPGVITMLQIGGLMLSIPLILLFAPKLGILGAGLALLVSTTARFILVMVSFPIFLKLPMPDVLPRWADCQTLFAILQQRLKRTPSVEQAGTSA
jgi:O-antigen/teichoic acid export membrane protein